MFPLIVGIIALVFSAIGLCLLVALEFMPMMPPILYRVCSMGHIYCLMTASVLAVIAALVAVGIAVVQRLIEHGPLL